MKRSGTFIKSTVLACLTAGGVSGQVPVQAFGPANTDSGESSRSLAPLESVQHLKKTEEPCVDHLRKPESHAIGHRSNPVDTPANIKRMERGESITSVEEHALKRWVRAKVLIKATPKVVWDTVHEERHHNPEIQYSKVLEQGRNHAIIEQKFCVVPVIGTAVCVMKNTEVPMERIDYEMIKSDRFKAMDGSWIFTPTADGAGTYLELTTHTDTGLPFPRLLQEGVTTKKLQKRLANVKQMAESTQNRVAVH